MRLAKNFCGLFMLSALFVLFGLSATFAYAQETEKQEATVPANREQPAQAAPAEAPSAEALSPELSLDAEKEATVPATGENKAAEATPVVEQTETEEVKTKTGSPTPLFFPAEKNNLQILPQKFEYGLMDENTTRIGDILIDATKLSFQILPTNNGKYRLRFTWPAGLLIEGHIILKDNIGKALVTEEFNPKNVKIRQSAKADSGEKLRAEIAEFVSAPVEPSVVEEMKFVPFMTFCVFRENFGTRIFLCSKEMYVASTPATKNKPLVKYRTGQKKVAAVEINRQKVGEQGLIFLNDAKENLLFKSFSQSGSTLEIETRRRHVDFKDVTTNADGSKIFIRMAGTEPVDLSTARKLGENDWELKIPSSRPILYLKGEGDIPMRQEFLVKGPLPTEKDRPVLTSASNPRTYSSSFSVTGKVPPKSKATAADKDSQVQMTDASHFQWYSSNLPSDATTRRYLAVNRENKKQIVGYDIFRGLPFEANIAATLYAPATLFYGRLGFQWWIEDFFGIDSSATHLHWGLNLEQNQHLTSKDTEVKVDFTNIELMYRFNAGFHLQDPTWGLLFPVQMAKTDAASATLMGLGVFAIQQPSLSLQSWMSWYTLKLRYFLASSGADVKVKQAYQLDAKAYTPISGNFFFTTGLGLSLYKYDPAAAKEANQFLLEAGLAYHF